MVTVNDILKCPKCGHIRDQVEKTCDGYFVGRKRSLTCSGKRIVIKKGDNLQNLGIEVGSTRMYPEGEYELFCCKECKNKVGSNRWSGFDASDW